MKINRKKSLHGILSISMLCFFVTAGCQSLPTQDVYNSPAFTEKTAPQQEVRLVPGDVLELKFFYTPELNTVQTVRPDGIISLQLVGDVNVQGKTPSEVKEYLLEKYSEHIHQLDITVIVQSLENRRVYIGGAVSTPGSIPMPGKLTALEAIMLAGGVTFTNGTFKNVIIIRNRNGKWIGAKLDLKKAFDGENTEPFYLDPQDIVYIPEKRIVRINRWIDQNINGILPNVGFTYTIVPGAPNTLGIAATINPVSKTQ